MSVEKRAVLLMNLGSPDSTSVSDVKKYLHEFLMDERVIDVPLLWRNILVKGLIVPRRAAQSAHAYSSIWREDGSPLVSITKALQAELSKLLHEPVEIAMRYGSPSMKYAFDKIARTHPDVTEVIMIPLYPQFAMSSFETAVMHAKDIHKKGGYTFRIRNIKPFYNNPAYLHALAESIRPYVQQPFDHLMFSYHGLPERHILKSDRTGEHCKINDECCNDNQSPALRTCYRHQCFFTTHAIAHELNIPRDKYSIAFQSRLGRAAWLNPDTAVRLTELPKEGKKNLLILCPAFVSDCLETLEEINIRGRESFMEAGGTSYTYIPCLNTNPLWVKTIAGWVSHVSDKHVGHDAPKAAAHV
jgi:protoporphyrin/coproporphyrin ferrochelatase